MQQTLCLPSGSGLNSRTVKTTQMIPNIFYDKLISFKNSSLIYVLFAFSFFFIINK